MIKKKTLIIKDSILWLNNILCFFIFINCKKYSLFCNHAQYHDCYKVMNFMDSINFIKNLFLGEAAEIMNLIYLNCCSYIYNSSDSSIKIIVTTFLYMNRKIMENCFIIYFCIFLIVKPISFNMILLLAYYNYGFGFMTYIWIISSYLWNFFY